jgi:hypothetical protein
MACEDSPLSSAASFWIGTRGTSRWMSIRSSSGPLMRFWYLLTSAGVQVQGFSLSPL